MAAVTTLSGAWKAGVREGMMLGVRIKTLPDLDAVRRGRNAWRVVTGARSCVFRMSDQVDAERAVRGPVGMVLDGDGRRRRPLRWRACVEVEGRAQGNVERWAEKREMVSWVANV